MPSAHHVPSLTPKSGVCQRLSSSQSRGAELKKPSFAPTPSLASETPLFKFAESFELQKSKAPPNLRDRVGCSRVTMPGGLLKRFNLGFCNRGIEVLMQPEWPPASLGKDTHSGKKKRIFFPEQALLSRDQNSQGKDRPRLMGVVVLPTSRLCAL